MIPLVDLKAQHDSIKNELDEAIDKVISNSEFIAGNEVETFEKNFAKFCDKKHCIGVSNGSTALYVILKTLGIGQGDEIIIPVNTFVATASAVTLCGGKPVFVDVNGNDFLINVDLIEEKITNKTKAIIPVHLYGGVCDMDKISEIAQKYKLHIVEDCAQAHGAKYKGKKVPVKGIGTFSFFPAKILGAMGDAGGIVLDDESLAKDCRKFINHGRLEKYLHDSEGFNFRLGGIQSAVLNVKLKYIEDWILKRRKLAIDYSEALKNNVGFFNNSKDSWNSHYMYVILSDRRDELMEFLSENGIGTGIHYPVPLHLQPVFSKLGHSKGDFPVAEKLVKKILSIPLYPELDFEDQKRIIELIRNFFEKR